MDSATPPNEAGSVSRSVAKGAVTLFSTQPLTWAASALTIALVPRFLGSEALGRYTVAMTIANLAATVFGLGVASYLVRCVAQRRHHVRRDMGISLLVTITATTVGAVALALIVPSLGLPGVDARLLLIALVGMACGPAQWVLLSAFQGREEHKRWAWFNAANVVVVAAGGVLALLLGADVYVYAAVAVVLSFGTTLGAFKLSGLRPSNPTADLALIREFVFGGIKFLSASLSLFVASNIDRVILGALVPVAEVGWYAASIRIIYIPIFIPTLVINPLFPAIIRHAHEPAFLRRAIAESLRVVLLLTAPMSAGLIVGAQLVPEFLHWPPDFQNAVPLMQIQSVSLPLMAVDMVLGTVLMALGLESRWALVALAAAVFNPLLNLVCIPLFEQITGNGAIGASIVVILTELLMFAGALVLIPGKLLDSRTAWVLLRVVIATLATAGTAAALLPIALPLAVLGGGLVYVGATLVLRVVRLGDLRGLATRHWAQPR